MKGLTSTRYWGLIIGNISVIILFVFIFQFKIRTSRELVNLKAGNDATSQTFNQLYELFSSSSILESNIEGRKLESSLQFLFGEDSLDCSQVFRNGKSLVLYLSSEECVPCSEIISSELISVLDTLNPRLNIKLITDFESKRDYLIFQQTYSSLNFDILKTVEGNSLKLSKSSAYTIDENLQLVSYFPIDALFFPLFLESLPGLINYIKSN